MTAQQTNQVVSRQDHLPDGTVHRLLDYGLTPVLLRVVEVALPRGVTLGK